MANNFLTGTVGQYKGPFSANQIISIDTEYNLQLGISIGEKDAMVNWSSLSEEEEKEKWPWTPSSLIVIIDGNEKQTVLGKKYIYNPDTKIFHHTIVFPNGAPASTIVDYMILD